MVDSALKMWDVALSKRGTFGLSSVQLYDVRSISFRHFSEFHFGAQSKPNVNPARNNYDSFQIFIFKQSIFSFKVYFISNLFNLKSSIWEYHYGYRSEGDVGVFYCGNSKMIKSMISHECKEISTNTQNFHFFPENFDN